MPPAIVAKLNKTIVDIIAEPEVRERLIKAGVVVQGSTPEQFGKFMSDELTKWDTVRQKAGIEQK